MRIRVCQTTTYVYDTPPAGVTQMLRRTPRNHDGQYMLDWRIDLSRDCLLHQHEDAFGNITHSFTAEGPFDELTINVEGEVDTQDTNGVVSGTLERFPPSLFLRETPLTLPDAGMVDFAEAVRADSSGEPLALLHTLMSSLNDVVEVDTAQAASNAAEAFTARRGSDRDLAHIFIAAARHLGIPARYIGGHCFNGTGSARKACHGWAEAHVDTLGWIGFDPANCLCATDAYVRVAVGLDYLGAAPVRGKRFGGSGETEKMTVQIVQAG